MSCKFKYKNVSKYYATYVNTVSKFKADKQWTIYEVLSLDNASSHLSDLSCGHTAVHIFDSDIGDIDFAAD